MHAVSPSPLKLTSQWFSQSKENQDWFKASVRLAKMTQDYSTIAKILKSAEAQEFYELCQAVKEISDSRGLSPASKNMQAETSALDIVEGC